MRQVKERGGFRGGCPVHASQPGTTGPSNGPDQAPSLIKTVLLPVSAAPWLHPVPGQAAGDVGELMAQIRCTRARGSHRGESRRSLIRRHALCPYRSCDPRLILGRLVKRRVPGRQVRHLKPQLDHPDSPPPGGVTQSA